MNDLPLLHRTTPVLLLATLVFGCGDAGADETEAADGCEGAKCDDADDLESPCATMDSDVTGCCWIEPEQQGGRDVLVCHYAPASVAPVEVSTVVTGFDANRGILNRQNLAPSDAPHVAWVIEGYPLELTSEISARSDQVIGLVRGVASTERVRVASASDLDQARAMVLRLPVDVLRTKVYNRHVDGVVQLGFGHSLQVGNNPIEVAASDLLPEFGLARDLLIAVTRGSSTVAATITLATGQDPNTGATHDVTFSGPGAYVIDAAGMRPANDAELTAPIGTPIANCEVRGDLVCRKLAVPGVEAVRVIVQGASETGTPPAPQTLELGVDDVGTPLDAPGYPYTLTFEAETSPDMIGLTQLSERTHRVTRSVASAGAGTVTANLPFEPWEVTLQSAVDTAGVVDLDTWILELGERQDDRFAVLAEIDALESSPNPVTYRIAVPVGTTSLRGRAEVFDAATPSGQSVDVALSRGSWLLTTQGLEPAP